MEGCTVPLVVRLPSPTPGRIDVPLLQGWPAVLCVEKDACLAVLLSTELL